MPINIQQLKEELINNINNLDGATKEELLLLAKSVNELTTDRIVTVPTVDDLPLLYDDISEEYTFPSGNIFCVDSLNVLVISSDGKWIGMDGRLLRQDRPDKILYAWGDNNVGKLGTNDDINTSSPVTVAGGITNWSQISAGGYHSLALTDVGVLYAWGNNNRGEIGDGTYGTTLTSPVTVIGGIANWSKISTGNQFSLALTDTGILYAWGTNYFGEIGDGTYGSPRSSPVTVIGGITNWSQISAGQNHNLALTDAGVLYAWGANFSGRLGDDTVITRSSPVTVVGGITNWTQISGGAVHNLALTDTGILYAWGLNNRGQVGDDTVIARSSPVTVVGGITNWTQISTGEEHSLALTDTGVLYAWGRINRGQIGDGIRTNRSSPVTVVGGITNWSQISVGSDHNLALTDTGVLYAWGTNFGRLGDGTTTYRSSPVTVVGGITSWNQISAGGDHNLAINIQ
jgi:alpha-tubulin suppressor-like RCC1 family protein